MYDDKTRVTMSLEIKARNVPGIKGGDRLCNTKPPKDSEIIFDGGIGYLEYHDHKPQSWIRKMRAKGKGIVVSKGHYYQYVYRGGSR